MNFFLYVGNMILSFSAKNCNFIRNIELVMVLFPPRLYWCFLVPGTKMQNRVYIGVVLLWTKIQKSISSIPAPPPSPTDLHWPQIWFQCGRLVTGALLGSLGVLSPAPRHQTELHWHRKFELNVAGWCRGRCWGCRGALFFSCRAVLAWLHSIGCVASKHSCMLGAWPV